jgi:hypothetical protein
VLSRLFVKTYECYVGLLLLSGVKAFDAIWRRTARTVFTEYKREALHQLFAQQMLAVPLRHLGCTKVQDFTVVVLSSLYLRKCGS